MNEPKVLAELVEAVVHAGLHKPSWRRLRLAVSEKERNEIKLYMILKYGEYFGKIMGVPLVVQRGKRR